MNESVRHLLMAKWLLAFGAAIASCGSPASPELELAQLRAELRGEGALTAGAAAPEDDEPETPPECDCGPLISWPPPECPRARWFCNAVGHCACDQPAGPASEVLSSGAASSARTATARALRPIAAESPELPEVFVGDDGADLDCMCVGATVSPPQGGCALEDWFCNASGLCRCRS